MGVQCQDIRERNRRRVRGKEVKQIYDGYYWTGLIFRWKYRGWIVCGGHLWKSWMGRCASLPQRAKGWEIYLPASSLSEADLIHPMVHGLLLGAWYLQTAFGKLEPLESHGVWHKLCCCLDSQHCGIQDHADSWLLYPEKAVVGHRCQTQ